MYGHVKGNMEITDDEFLQLWENISQALIGVAANLGPTSKCNDWQTKIDKLLKDPLTAEDERNVQELQKWYKKDKDIKKSLDQLVDTTQKGKDSIERMEKNVEEIKKYLSELYELRPNSCENCTCTDAAILPVKLSCEIYAHSDQQGDLCGMSVNGDASRATAQEVLNQIAKSYLQIVESSTKKECNEFMEYLTRMGEVLVVDVIKGSLMIKVGCRSVQILSDLYIDFLTGHLNALAQEHLVTERVLTKFALMEAKLTTNISESEYRNCRKQLKAYAVLEPKVLDLKNRRDKLQEKFLEWVKVRKKIRSSLERPLQDRRMYSCSTFHWLVALVAVGLMAAISTFDVLAADEDIGLGVVICIGLWVCLGLALSATIASKPGSNKENDLGDDKNALQKVSSDARLLGKCVASLSICCRNHTEQVLTSKVMAREFPFLIDILRESGSEFHRESKSMLQALIKRELNIHSKGFQSLLTTNREILQELHEGPSQDEIQEMIVDFIKVEFDKNRLKFHQTSPFLSHFH